MSKKIIKSLCSCFKIKEIINLIWEKIKMKLVDCFIFFFQNIKKMWRCFRLKEIFNLIRIRITNTDMDPAAQMIGTGYGSTTLMYLLFGAEHAGGLWGERPSTPAPWRGGPLDPLPRGVLHQAQDGRPRALSGGRIGRSRSGTLLIYCLYGHPARVRRCHFGYRLWYGFCTTDFLLFIQSIEKQTWMNSEPSSVADPGCLSRIPDPKTAKTKERGENKFVAIPFL